MFFEVAYRSSIRIVGVMSCRFTHSKSFVGRAVVPASAGGAPSRRIAKTMHPITRESVRSCRWRWRIGLGDALQKKSRSIFGNVEANFEIGMLATDLRRSTEE